MVESLEDIREQNIISVFLEMIKCGNEIMIDTMIKCGTPPKHFEAMIQAAAKYDRARWVSSLPIVQRMDPPEDLSTLKPFDVCYIGPPMLTLEPDFEED